MKLAMIMLAAGNSRRFGENKLLYEIDGKPMYLRCLETLMQAKERLSGIDLSCQAYLSEHPVDVHPGCQAYDKNVRWTFFSVTVVTQYGEIVRAARSLGAEALLNPCPKAGISDSLKIGLTANLDADACLFTVSDQPYLTAETICGLVECFRKSGRGMACVQADNRCGNPCIFSKKYFPDLFSLKGDTGGRKVINAHPKDVALYEILEEKELEDVDFA